MLEWPRTDGAKRYTTAPPTIHGTPRRAMRPIVVESIPRMGAGSLVLGGSTTSLLSRSSWEMSDIGAASVRCGAQHS